MSGVMVGPVPPVPEGEGEPDGSSDVVPVLATAVIKRAPWWRRAIDRRRRLEWWDMPSGTEGEGEG